MIPRQESKSKRVELVIADPMEGIHLIKENDSHAYMKSSEDFLDFDPSEQDPERIGKVEFIALSSRGKGQQ